LDKLARIRRADCAPQLRVGRAWFSHQKIFADRAVEKKTFLRHQTDVLPQRANAVFADLLSIDKNPAIALFQFVKTREQTRERRFARPGRADQRNRFAGSRM